MSIQWKTVYGLNHLLVSNDGQVKAKARLCRRKDGGKGDSQYRNERVIIPADKQGYLWVNSTKDGQRKFISVHRMIVEAFIRPLQGTEEINHINGKRNDNRLENLEIVPDKATHNRLTWERVFKEHYDAGYAQALKDNGLFK